MLIDNFLKVHDLVGVDNFSDLIFIFWFNLSPIYHFSEILYEDESFEERELSALVASKVYYHLGAYDEALHYALGAATLLNFDQSSEYIDTVVGESAGRD